MTVDAEPLYATILIVVVTRQRILLAADSRRTYLDAKGVYKTGVMQKIKEINSFYYAIAGFYEDEVEDFSIARLLESVFSTTTNSKQAVITFTQQLAVALKTYLLQLKNTQPQLLLQLKRHSASGGEVFIITKEDHKPTTYIVTYQFREQEDIQVIVNTSSIGCAAFNKDDHCFFQLVGSVTTDSSGRFTEAQWADTPVKNIHWVMQESQKAFPDFVGEPFSILALCSKEAKWL